MLGAIGGASPPRIGNRILLEHRAVRPPQPIRLDPQPWFFRIAAAWLVIGSFLAFISSFRWSFGAALPSESHVLSEVMLRGFVLQAILAIAPRAFRGHLGAPVVSARRQALLLLLINAGLSLGRRARRFALPGFEPLARLWNVAVAAASCGDGWLRLSQFRSALPRGRTLRWAIPWRGRGCGVCSRARMVGRAPEAACTGKGHRCFSSGSGPLMLAMAHIVFRASARTPVAEPFDRRFRSALAWPLQSCRPSVRCARGLRRAHGPRGSDGDCHPRPGDDRLLRTASVVRAPVRGSTVTYRAQPGTRAVRDSPYPPPSPRSHRIPTWQNP